MNKMNKGGNGYNIAITFPATHCTVRRHVKEPRMKIIEINPR